MNIKTLLENKVSSLQLDELVTIDKNIYANTDILDLSKVIVKGKITYPSNDNLFLDVTCSATMVLNDSVTLLPVNYDFSFNIAENVYKNLEKSNFSLDIISILWENIVLEIPIRYSEVTDYKNLVGDGWKVISEDDFKYNTNNPFKDLLIDNEEE